MKALKAKPAAKRAPAAVKRKTTATAAKCSTRTTARASTAKKK